MKMFNNFFLEKFCQDLIYIKSGKIDDVKEEEIRYKFMTDEVSYIPIIRNEKGECLGVVSRKKYFFSLLKKNKFNIQAILTEIPVVKLEDSLDSTLKKLKNSSGLLLKINGEFKKFISPRVVSNAFESYSLKFILIEKVEKLIRRYISKNKIDFTQILSLKNQEKKSNNSIKTIDDLFFNDYHLIFSKKWEEIDLYKNNLADKRIFLSDLNEVAQMRNDLFHFRNSIPYNQKKFKNIIKILN